MNGTPLALLGRAALVAGPAAHATADAELAYAGPPDARVRTLFGRLGPAPAGMARWPRLDRYGRALTRAIAEALSPSPPGSAGLTTGLYVASEYSCFETNATFHRGLVDKGPRFASPMLFPYTLPGAAAAEAAMHFHLLGEHLVFCGGPAAALAALLAAADGLDGDEARSIVVASADVLGRESLAARLAAGEVQPDMPLAEGAAALWLGPRWAGAHGQGVVVEGALGPAGGELDACEALAREALERAGVFGGELARIVSASITEPCRRAEIEAAAAVAPSLAVAQPGTTLGDAGASLGLLAVLDALVDPGPALVLAADRGGSVALVVARTAG